jgi:hypothetical protein
LQNEPKPICDLRTLKKFCSLTSANNRVFMATFLKC